MSSGVWGGLEQGAIKERERRERERERERAWLGAN
jgi:hypothetical protein